MAIGSTPTIMIFCDNDSRWQLQYDEEEGQDLWFNPGMGLVLPPGSVPQCQVQNSNSGKCAPYSARLVLNISFIIPATYSTRRGHIPPRSEITLCDRVLRFPFATMAQLASTIPGGNVASPQGHGITEYSVISRTALHELTHAWPARQLGSTYRLF